MTTTEMPTVAARMPNPAGLVPGAGEAIGALAAASLLATIPSLLFFALIQRRLTSGLLTGAVKG